MIANKARKGVVSIGISCLGWEEFEASSFCRRLRFQSARRRSTGCRIHVQNRRLVADAEFFHKDSIPSFRMRAICPRTGRRRWVELDCRRSLAEGRFSMKCSQQTVQIGVKDL